MTGEAETPADLRRRLDTLPKTRLIRWGPGTVTVVERGSTRDRSPQSLRATLTAFSRVTGTTRFVYRATGGDVSIAYVPHSEYLKQAPADSAGYCTYDGVAFPGRIGRAHIYVDTVYRATRHHVMVHELAHAVALLYDPRLKLGTSPEQFQELRSASAGFVVAW